MRVGRASLAGAVMVLIVAAGTPILIHHVRGARFETTVAPIRSFDACVRATQLELRQVGAMANSSEECQTGAPSIWFKVTVRNTGHRAAWVNTCDIQTLDRNGHATLGGTVRTRWLNFPAGPYLEPGEQVFFVSPMLDDKGGSLLTPPPGITSFGVSCPPIDYHGNVPA